MVMVLPLLFALFTVTIDLSHYFGIRDELQRVIDREAHDALVYDKTSQQVTAAIRNRMGNLGGMAEITSVRSTRSRGRNVIFVDGTYQGAFAEVAQRLYGQRSAVLSFAARAEVRIQPSAALILFDRSSVPVGSECADAGLRAMSLFVDRLTDSWIQSADTAVSVGVFPGVTAPIDLLSVTGSDPIPRCRGRAAGAHVDASAVQGTSGMGRFSVSAVAYRAQELATTILMRRPVQIRSVVFVMRRAAYDAGYAAMTYTLVQNLVGTTNHPIDFFVLVLDDAGSINSRPFASGINGGSYREVSAVRTDFESLRLLGTATQTITDRIMLER
jgi:hypothetical protein